MRPAIPFSNCRSMAYQAVAPEGAFNVRTIKCDNLPRDVAQSIDRMYRSGPEEFGLLAGVPGQSAMHVAKMAGTAASTRSLG